MKTSECFRTSTALTRPGRPLLSPVALAVLLSANTAAALADGSDDPCKREVRPVTTTLGNLFKSEEFREQISVLSGVCHLERVTGGKNVVSTPEANSVVFQLGQWAACVGLLPVYDHDGEGNKFRLSPSNPRLGCSTLLPDFTPFRTPTPGSR